MIPKSIQFTGDHTRVMKLHLDVKERKRERETLVESSRTSFPSHVS